MVDSTTGEPELRTSGLGIIALACALLSVAACVVVAVLSVVGVPAAMVGVLVLPLLGLVGVVFGGVSLARKRAPDGAVYTRGPAVAGVIIGLASAVLQGSVLVGAMRTFAPIKQQVVPVVNAMVREARAGHVDRASEAVGEGARGVVGPRLEGFAKEIVGVCGDDVRATFSIGALVRATVKLRETMAKANPAAFQSGSPPKPVEFQGSRGRLSAWVLLDEAALDKGQVKITDMMAILPDGRALVLLPDGRFAQLARGVGMESVEIGDEKRETRDKE